MKDFIAHLHPLLVHLPIGILLLAALFSWMAPRERYAGILPAVPWLWRLGAVSALVACGSGWLLGNSDTYDAATLQWHQWLGIATTGIAAIACFVTKRLVLACLSTALVIATGHFGGTMTHGEGYLSPSVVWQAAEKKRPADVQETPVYAGIIAPIFQEKCVSCHGSSKQKGGLRLDLPEQIQKGGKNGDVLQPGQTGVSELLRRCLLSIGHEEHMPPKEKPQLTLAEIEILRWWLAQGADFQKETKDLPQTEMLKNALTQWQTGAVAAPAARSDVPEFNPPEPSPVLVENLRRAGLVILPVGAQTNWLSVSFINLPNPTDSVITNLGKLSPQVLYLNLSYCSVPEQAWSAIGQLTQLTRLTLDHASVTDEALALLKNMANLQYLNLAHTQVTSAGMRHLTGLKSLQRVFLFQSAVKKTEWADLQAAWPHATLDSGGYNIPFMDVDTARLKAKPAY